MPRKAQVVALLRFYQGLRVVTRTEVGVMVGKNRNQIAGICDSAVPKIKPWPKVPRGLMRKRSCCFLVSAEGAVIPKLCGKPCSPQSTFLCEEHVGKTIWDPPNP